MRRLPQKPDKDRARLISLVENGLLQGTKFKGDLMEVRRLTRKSVSVTLRKESGEIRLFTIIIKEIKGV